MLCQLDAGLTVLAQQPAFDSSLSLVEVEQLALSYSTSLMVQTSALKDHLFQQGTGLDSSEEQGNSSAG